MIKFLVGLALGLSVAAASADFVIQQPNGTFATIKANVSGGVQTVVVTCDP